MLADIITGLLSILNISSILAISFGLTVGLLFGAIPGISGIMAISILLPLTFYVSPLVGIPMLLGIYKASIYGGSITAILLNTPGAPPAVCTAMDGFPLTQQGKGGKALNAALAGSVFGDTFSNILLIVVAAPISYVAIKIGPVEQFCLILLSLTVVGSISGNSILKGMICAGFGIMLSMIGVSGMSGAVRYTFGSEYLLSGIALIPMVIGVLCLPEIIHQVGATTVKFARQTFDPKSENGRYSWSEFIENLGVMFRSSLIGSVIGAMPGLGASPAAFMAYSEAQRKSKNPDLFGKGNVEGVIAPEAANNATTGSAMIPLLTLGIPGDDVTAVLMGAFLIQGLTPGPNIFFEHTQVVYGIFGALLLCDLLLFFIAKFGFRFWLRVVEMPRHVIFSAVTVFAFIGTYSINQSLFDLFCLIVFGIVGYLMRVFHFSAGALIIGFILGPILEKAYDQSMSISGGSYMIFLEKPFAAVLLLATVGSVISIYRVRARKQRLLEEKEALLCKGEHGVYL